MSVKFEYYETPDASGGKSGKFHPRVVTLRTVDTERIADRIHKASSLTIGDVKAVLSALSEEIAYHLSMSERVHLEGIGYFQVTLKAGKEVDPKKTRAQSVWFKSVAFRADKELKEKLIYVKTERSTIKRHSTVLTNEQVDRKVALFFEKNDFLTRKRLEEICKFTPTMAARQIKRLKEEGKIKNINTHTQPVYVAAEEGVGK